LAGIGIDTEKWLSVYKSSSISERRQDSTKVSIEDQYEQESCAIAKMTVDEVDRMSRTEFNTKCGFL